MERPAANPNDRPAGAFSDPDLWRRIASAAALAPIAVGCAWYGGWPFAGFWLLAAMAVLWEWNRLVMADKRVGLFAVEIVALGATVIALHAARNPLAAVAVLGVGVAAAAVFASAGERRWSMGGVVYASAVAAGPIILRDDPGFGFVAILWLFAIVWGADVAAYFAGRTLGGPRLWPSLSPKKTWSGFVGGLAFGAALGVGIGAAAGVPVGFGLAVVSMAVAILSQGGDLLESAVKRRFQAKDAGALIPGHGGAMDRLDGFLVAGVCAALFGLLRGGLDAPAAGVLVW